VAESEPLLGFRLAGSPALGCSPPLLTGWRKDTPRRSACATAFCLIEAGTGGAA